MNFIAEGELMDNIGLTDTTIYLIHIMVFEGANVFDKSFE